MSVLRDLFILDDEWVGEEEVLIARGIKKAERLAAELKAYGRDAAEDLVRLVKAADGHGPWPSKYASALCHTGLVDSLTDEPTRTGRAVAAILAEVDNG